MANKIKSRTRMLESIAGTTKVQDSEVSQMAEGMREMPLFHKRLLLPLEIMDKHACHLVATTFVNPNGSYKLIEANAKPSDKGWIHSTWLKLTVNSKVDEGVPVLTIRGFDKAKGTFNYEVKK